MSKRSGRARTRSPAPARRTSQRIPKLCKHKASGRGVVRIAGRDVYLGKYGTRECKAEYDRVIAQWLAEGRPTTSTPEADAITVDELIAAWWPVLERRYSGPRSAATLVKHREALRVLHDLFGRELALDFGPKKLTKYRDALLGAGRLCRKETNRRVQMVRRLIEWGVSEELLPPEAAHALSCVKHLVRGDGGRDSRKIKAVPWEDVEPILPHVSREVAALIRLQWHCGARSGELVGIRPADIDRSDDVWRCVLERHKTEHHDRERVILFGPRAQEVLRPFLDRVPMPDSDEPLFSPRAAEAERSVARRDARRSPLTPSQRKRKRKRAPRVAPGELYDPASYRRAIERGIDAANADRLREAMAAAVPECAERIERIPVSKLISKKHETTVDPERLLRACDGDIDARDRALEVCKDVKLIGRWHPHQLRHACATRLRRELGIEAARVVLGHSSALVTEVYAEIDRANATVAMERLG